MKKFSLLFLAMFTTFCLPAKAFSFPEQLYLKSSFGVNYLHLNDWHIYLVDTQYNYDIKAEMDTGSYSAISIGYRFDERFRVEAEIAYRSNRADQIKIRNEKYTMDGILHSYSTIANIYIDLPFKDKFNFYMGSGIGHQKMNGSLKMFFTQPEGLTSSRVDIKNEGMVVQGLIGGSLKLTHSVWLEVDYKSGKIIKCDPFSTLCVHLRKDF